MAILDELNDALKEAMKTKEKAKLDAIRQVKSEIEEKSCLLYTSPSPRDS